MASLRLSFALAVTLIVTRLCLAFQLGSSLVTNQVQHLRPKSQSCIVMKIRVGILGLPNVGKSTLFNALAQKSIAQAANFPFCTIEPNVAPIAVPDQYLIKLANFSSSAKTVSATMDWVDVAGLAKGAHRGEGLGNQFLGSLRECHAICHVVRTFPDDNIIHVDGAVDPKADAEAVNLELLLADEAHVERRLSKTTCQGIERDVLEKVVVGLETGIPARAVGLEEDEKFAIKSMGLLTLKPVIYAFNVDEVDFILDRCRAMKAAQDTIGSIEYSDPNVDTFTVVCAKLESELSTREQQEQIAYLESLGVETEDSCFAESLSFQALPKLVQNLLNLSIVYTGPGVPPERSKTTKAHLFSHMTAEDLAGKLHGDILKGFVKAEVSAASSLLQHESYTKAKESGCIRTEGRDYMLESDNVVLIRYK